MRSLPPIGAILLLSLAACQEPANTEADGETSNLDAPTWHEDVAPIVAGHCQGCHTEGGPTFSFDYYDLAKPMATAMAAEVEARRMPPWSAMETDECQPRLPFKDDLRLSEDEIQTLRDWADAGAPEGDPAKAAALPEPTSLILEDASARVSPLAPYSAAGNEDEFICFVIDPALQQDVWLTGLQVVPGNGEVVHHVLVFSDASGDSLAKANEDGQYSCFGGVGINSGQLLGAWAPGAVPMQTPEGAGMSLTAGSLLVMQVHYHPRGQEADPDLTSLDLRWTTEQPAREAVLALVGNASNKRQGLESGPNDASATKPEFLIPAGAVGHTETMHFDIDGGGPYTLWAAGTHMHYIGTDMLIQLEHADPQGDEPSTECLIQTPKWDFDWQRAYTYDGALDEVPVIRDGDTLRLRCTYDNTTDNPGVLRALADAGLDAPVDVSLGETTLDEMCIGVFGVIFDN